MAMKRGGCGPRCGMGARLADEDSWAVIRLGYYEALCNRGDYSRVIGVAPAFGGGKVPDAEVVQKFHEINREG